MYDFQLNQKQVSAGDNSSSALLNRESVVATNQNLSNGDLATADSANTAAKRRFKMPKISHDWIKEPAIFAIPAGIMLSIALGSIALGSTLVEEAHLEKPYTAYIVAFSTYADAVALEAEDSSDVSDLLALERSVNAETKSVAVVISGSGESLKVEGGLDLDNDNVIDKNSEIVTIGSINK